MNIQELLLRGQKAVASNNLPLMEGKEKGEINDFNRIYTINDFDFMKGNNGDFAVFTIKETQDYFFFGATVLTDKLKTLQQTFTSDELAMLLQHGITVKFGKNRGKSGFTYTTADLFVDVQVQSVEHDHKAYNEKGQVIVGDVLPY